MAIHIPAGGFLAVVDPDPSRLRELRRRLEEAGARVSGGEAGSPLFAAWTEFPGQGLWVGDHGAVACDLDLTNAGALRRETCTGPEAEPGELLWALYRRHGAGLADRLRGPFAFALWDARERRFLVVTDPYGIRPVVYAPLEEGIVAASRIRHVLAHPGVDRGIDLQAVHHYLFFTAVPSPATIYRGVRRLEPGHLLEHREGRTADRAYYDIRYAPQDWAGERHWRLAIPLEVRRAVGRFVPLSPPEATGCFLSGGTDSSSVAGFYTRLAGRPARTFSIGFDEPGYNELDYAHIAVRHFGTEQHEYFVTPADVLALVEALPRLYEEPFGNASVIPTYYCARMAREHGVRVLLAGDGGDEIFGGNERYVKNLVFERYHALPGPLRRGVLEPALSRLPGTGVIHKAKRYVRRANIPNPDRFYSYNLLAETDPNEIFLPEFLSEIDPDGFLAIARRHYARAAPAHVTDRLLYLDMKLTVTDNDLRKVTRMTEAAGIRVRYPLLDRELVDFTATIPPTLKVKPGRGRYIFKRAMEGFLPREIIEKKKHGFGLPVTPWFRKHAGLSQLLNDNLFDPGARITEWVRPEFLLRMKRGFETDTTTYYGSNLWVFLMLELWLRHTEHGGG